MTRILLLYSTTDGHTVKICNRLQEVIELHAHPVTLAAVKDAHEIDLKAFDKIVIGASIRYGKHNPQVAAFINRHAQLLASKSYAFFSVNIVARKPEKNLPETNPYMHKFLQQITRQPKELAVFAGKLDYPRYGFLDRLMIRFIMLITNGPTDPTAVVEFTDWTKVEAFGRKLAQA